MRDVGKPPEVLVFREQNPVLQQGVLHDLSVDGPLLGFAHGDNVVPIGAKGPHSRKVAAFIGEETH